MRRRPVNVPALPAKSEVLLRREYVRRDLVFDFVLGDGFERAVALHAAVKDLGERI